MDDRREFLGRVARGVAYSAPVIYTLAAPRRLMGITPSGMIRMAPGAAPATQAEGVAPWDAAAPGGAAPWTAPPPGSEAPGTSGGSGGGTDD